MFIASSKVWKLPALAVFFGERGEDLARLLCRSRDLEAFAIAIHHFEEGIDGEELDVSLHIASGRPEELLDHVEEEHHGGAHIELIVTMPEGSAATADVRGLLEDGRPHPAVRQHPAGRQPAHPGADHDRIVVAALHRSLHNR